MGRDSAGDTTDETIKTTDLGNGYQVQWVMMAGYRLLKDGKPITGYWVDAVGAANIMVQLMGD